MQLVTINSTVRSALVTMNRPIHYYVRCLHFALKCAEELKLGVLMTTKTLRLTLDEFNELTIPTDFVDWVKVGYERGKYVVPLGEVASINDLANVDSGGAQIVYPNVFEGQTAYYNNLYSYLPSYGYNDYREQLGKQFGYNDTGRGDNFKIIPSRNRIHIGNAFAPGDTIVLEYVYFDGTSTGSLISKYAAETIESYIIWKFMQFNRNVRLADVQMAERDYYNNFRKLMARMNPITKEMIKRIKRKNFKQSIKT